MRFDEDYVMVVLSVAVLKGDNGLVLDVKVDLEPESHLLVQQGPHVIGREIVVTEVNREVIKVTWVHDHASGVVLGVARELDVALTVGSIEVAVKEVRDQGWVYLGDAGRDVGVEEGSTIVDADWGLADAWDGADFVRASAAIGASWL